MKGFNPESSFAVTEKKLPKNEEELYKILVPENKERAIQLDEFADLYDPSIIEKDKQYVADFENKFAQEDAEKNAEVGTKFSELFEAIINYQIENSDLMGPNADVVIPSRFDDIANGIDGIVRFKGEKGMMSHVALAIDVTKSKITIEKKFNRIKRSIQSGELSKVKYFKSKNFRGELKPVARVVIGADHEITDGISELILRFTRLKKAIAENRKRPEATALAENLRKEFSQVRQQLAAHPLHAIVLTEIRNELEAFRTYAETHHQETAASEYGKILHIIDEVVQEKELSSNFDIITEQQDEVFNLILENTKAFNGRGE